MKLHQGSRRSARIWRVTRTAGEAPVRREEESIAATRHRAASPACSIPDHPPLKPVEQRRKKGKDPKDRKIAPG